MKSRKKLKQRILPSKQVKNTVFKKQVMDTMREANEHIKSVSKKYKGTTYMWSVNRLKTRLGSKYFRGNRIVIPKNVKNNDLLLMYKEIESFLKSKESTKSGIKEVQEKAKLTIKEELFGKDEDTGEYIVTDEDVDVYYSLLEDKDFASILNKDFDASEFWVIIDDAIREKDNLKSFKERINTYLDLEEDKRHIIKDEELRKKVTNLYYRYIKNNKKRK